MRHGCRCSDGPGVANTKQGQGAVRLTKDPKQLMTAQTCARAIEASGLFKNGLSLQTGGGGVPLTVTQYMRKKMIAQNVHASFALDGGTVALNQLYDEGYIDKLLIAQNFDAISGAALGKTPRNFEIDAGQYLIKGLLSISWMWWSSLPWRWIWTLTATSWWAPTGSCGEHWAEVRTPRPEQSWPSLHFLWCEGGSPASWIE